MFWLLHKLLLQDKLTPRECAIHNRHVAVVGWLDSIKSMLTKYTYSLHANYHIMVFALRRQKSSEGSRGCVCK